MYLICLFLGRASDFKDGDKSNVVSSHHLQWLKSEGSQGACRTEISGVAGNVLTKSLFSTLFASLGLTLLPFPPPSLKQEHCTFI